MRNFIFFFIISAEMRSGCSTTIYLHASLHYVCDCDYRLLYNFGNNLPDRTKFEQNRRKSTFSKLFYVSEFCSSETPFSCMALLRTDAMLGVKNK